MTFLFYIYFTLGKERGDRKFIINTKNTPNVFETWKNENENNKPLSITDPNMKRYFFHTDEAVSFVLDCIPLIDRGETFVPKMKSFKIKDLANKFSKNHKIIGLRQGEKLDEQLITPDEKKNALEKPNMWIINQYTK